MYYIKHQCYILTACVYIWVLLDKTHINSSDKSRVWRGGADNLDLNKGV